MRYKLSELAEYISEKINTNEIATSNYVSTVNLLPDKQGLSEIEELPNNQRVTKFKKGDVLISNIRPYFKKIWYADRNGGCSADVLVFRSKGIIDSKFLFTLLFQDSFFDYMVLYSKGTKMPRGDKKAIMNIEFDIPSEVIQREIKKFFFNLNSKIELNNKTINSLEEIAATLFKHWFVDFEFPDEKGNPYKSSGGKMVESELGELPEGWNISTLSNIANYENGLAMQKFRPEGEDYLPVLKIKELRQGYTDSNSDKCDLDIKNSVKVYDGDVIFSWSATLLVKLWTGGKAGLNQHLFKVTSDKYTKWFFYLWTKNHIEKFINIANDKATTMGHINRKHLNEAQVVIPTDKQLEVFDKTFNPLIEEIIDIGLENRTLGELRDILLPKLLSGEIELPVEEEVRV